MQLATHIRRAFRPEMTKTRFSFVLMLLLLFALACQCDLGNLANSNNDNNSNSSKNDNDNDNNNKNSNKDDNDNGRNSRKGNATEPDEGDFVVAYVPVKNPNYRALDENFRRQRVLEDAARRLNEALALPADVTLTTRDCGQINAFYQPGNKTLTICYELMDHFYTLFRSQGLPDEQAGREMQNAIKFVFFHELGHGLIDLYKLGVTGKEEDAVDQLATYVTVEELHEEEAALSGAKAFYFESKNQGKGQDLPFYDEHSLGPQRFYNIICWLFGHDPNKYQDVVGKILPESRAAHCPDEYTKFSRYWESQLKPYRK